LQSGYQKGYPLDKLGRSGQAFWWARLADFNGVLHVGASVICHNRRLVSDPMGESLMGVHSMIKVRRLLGAPLAAASLSLGVALAGTVGLPGTALALDLSSITQTDASAAVKAALQKGAESAVASLGKADGFLGNPEVKIPLPSSLQKLEKAAKLMGKQKDFEALQVNINRAAEAAAGMVSALRLTLSRPRNVVQLKHCQWCCDNSWTIVPYRLTIQ